VSSPKILTLVPTLPPTINGLGDYAYLLAKSLKGIYSLDTIFLNSDHKYINTYLDGFSIEIFKDKNSKTFRDLLISYNPNVLIINYVGYAYSKHGIPFWLTKALIQWKRTKADCTIITIFHELYASGLPWQKSFYLNFLQKSIAYKLFNLSNHVITNTEITFDILKKIDSEKSIYFIPVFSNITRCKQLKEFKARDNNLIIFGSAALRSKLFRNILLMTEWVEKLKIDKIIEIGPSRAEGVNSINGIPIFNSGVLSDSDISVILNNSKYGMLDYPTHLLSKSGVFGAYASHGVVPIIINGDNRGESLLQNGKHFLLQINESIMANEVSSNLTSWYESHNVEKTSELIFKMLIQK
jgi:hypothetical protein